MKYLSLKHWMLILLPFTFATGVFAGDGAVNPNPSDKSSVSEYFGKAKEKIQNWGPTFALAFAVGTSAHYWYEKYADKNEEEDEDIVTA